MRAHWNHGISAALLGVLILLPASPASAQSHDDFAYWDANGNGDLTCTEAGPASPAGGGVVAQIKCEVERDPDETGGMKSRVHPKYKTKYRVRNWASYERALIGRGNITIWLSRAAIAAWKPEGPRTRGAPPTYSDLAIETALTLRLLFHLPLRQAEGFLTSLCHLMGLDLRSPDHTTLSRRGQHLNLTLRRVPRRAALHLFIDSTGLSMGGEGEWAAAKHGRRGRRGWKKLHLGVDHAGVNRRSGVDRFRGG